MNGDEKCEYCQNAKCKIHNHSQIYSVIIKTSGSLRGERSTSLYEGKLRRWSRACGIDPKLYLLYCSIFKLSMYVAATVIFPVSTKSLSEPIVGAGGLMPIIDKA